MTLNLILKHQTENPEKQQSVAIKPTTMACKMSSTFSVQVINFRLDLLFFVHRQKLSEAI